MSDRTDEQDGSLLFGDATFALQADRKGLYLFRLLNGLETNLRNTVLIYPHNTCANWILALGNDRPHLIILPWLRCGEIADTNHAALTPRLPRDRRFCIRWSRRRRREGVKRRLHQGIDGAYISKLPLDTHATYR